MHPHTKHLYLFIFRTNIRTEADRANLQRTLDRHEEIAQWTIDQQDIDCVLRIFSGSLCPEKIILLVSRLGYECAELI